MMNSRKIIADGLAATIIIGSFQLPAVIPTVMPVGAADNLSLGDINNDGAITVVDASMVLGEYARVAAGQEPSFTEEQKNAGDSDRNGKLTVVDASIILSYYAYTAANASTERKSFEQFLGLTDSSIDYSNIPEIGIEDENEYFSVKDGKLYTAKSGYFGVIAEFSDNVFTYVTQGYQMQSDSLESAVTELTGYGLAQYDSDGFVQTLNGEVKNLYILYGTDSSEVTAMYRMNTEGYTVETEPVAMPYFWVQPNKEKTEASTEGVVVYSVRARMGYDKMTSWDDVAVPDETLPHLERVVCKTQADEDGYSNWASVDGFDADTYYDEFDVYFYANGTYTLSVTDTAGNYTYYELEIDGVGDNAIVENPYDNLDLTAPKLTIDVPSGKVPEGSVVKVKVTSDEPCVMLIGGECFGSTDNPVTEAVFEAYYNSSYSVVATDLAHNTTQTSFTVENFVESSIYEDIDETGGRNPYDPSNRDNFWNDFEDESEE